MGGVPNSPGGVTKLVNNHSNRSRGGVGVKNVGGRMGWSGQSNGENADIQ